VRTSYFFYYSRSFVCFVYFCFVLLTFICTFATFVVILLQSDILLLVVLACEGGHTFEHLTDYFCCNFVASIFTRDYIVLKISNIVKYAIFAPRIRNLSL